MSGTGDHVVVVGAASKGIIQREFQHHAMVYRQIEIIIFMDGPFLISSSVKAGLRTRRIHSIQFPTRSSRNTNDKLKCRKRAFLVG